MAEQFEVTADDLNALAAAFDQQAGEVAAAIPGFRSAAYDVHDAFGVLGPSRDILREYLDATQEFLRGLDALAERLAGDAARLRATAANYTGADDASQQGFQGGLRL